jgi:hypothetical protein
MEMFTGKIHDKDIGFKVEEGFKDPEGNLFYRTDAPENDVVIKMRDVGTKVQAYYKAHGKYPEGAELAKVAKIEYKNPFVGGPEVITTNSIKWPKDMNAKQIFLLSPYDLKLESGSTWDGESSNRAGEISALSSHTTNPTASVCFVHGRDRHGELLKRADGKVLLLMYKNGLDVTPIATLLVIKDNNLVPLRVTSDSIPPNILTSAVSYLIMLGFLISTIFFAVKHLIRLRTKGFASKPSLMRPIASGWSFLMFILCLIPKFAPDNISDIVRLWVTPAVFVLGLIGMFVYMVVTKPKPRKPGT